MQSLEMRVRPRSRDEANLLGCAMARRYFFALWPAGLCVFLPAAVLGGFAGWRLGWLWMIVVVWALRPAAEVLMLAVLSRLIFAGRPRRLMFADVPPVKRWLQMLPEFLWLRLFPSGRIMRMAAIVLEGNAGWQKRERLRVMRRSFTASGGFSTVLVLGALELLLILGAVIWFDPLPKGSRLPALEFLLSRPEHGYWLVLALLSALAMSVMSVFFVCIDFSHYLNFRIISEGWAAALGMQKLAAKLQGMASALLLSCVLLFAIQPVQPAFAQPSEADRALIARLEHDPKTTPYKMAPAKDDKPAENPFRGLSMPEGAGVKQLRLLIVLVLIGAVIAFAVYLWRRRGTAGKTEIIADDAQMAQELPAAAPAVDDAARVLAAGDVRLAVALLYQAAAAMSAAAPSDSGREVLAKAGEKAYLARLLPVFEQTVFAHRLPDIDTVRALLSAFPKTKGAV